MSRVKKILATLIVMTMVASSFTVGAATQSPYLAASPAPHAAPSRASAGHQHAAQVAGLKRRWET